MPTETSTAPQASRPSLNQPRSRTDLFVSFTLLALQGFGGVVAVVQRELVEKRQWLSNEEFMEDWAVAQIMPGPNVVNLSIMLGERYFGWRGAIVGLLGMLTFPMLVVISLTLIYSQFADNPAVAGALRGMGAVAGGLIAAIGVKMLPQLRKHPLGFGVCLAFAAVVLVAIAWFRIPLGWVLLVAGGVACVWTWRRIPA